MNPYQEPKYEIKNGKLHNRQSGEQIPDDEPLFVLRARDKHAAEAIAAYRKTVCCGDHYGAVTLRLQQFENWAAAHPERMKEPDTQKTDDWTNRANP